MTLGRHLIGSGADTPVDFTDEQQRLSPDRAEVRKFSLRDCWLGAAVFGIVGPLIALFGIAGMFGGFQGSDAGAFTSLLVGGWVFAPAFGMLPGALTDLARPRRRPKNREWQA